MLHTLLDAREESNQKQKQDKILEDDNKEKQDETSGEVQKEETDRFYKL